MEFELKPIIHNSSFYKQKYTLIYSKKKTPTIMSGLI